LVSGLRRRIVLGPLALLALSSACSQMLGIEDARLDPSLVGGTSSTSGTGAMADAGLSSGGTVDSAGGHSGGAAQQAGADAVGASAGTNESSAGAGGGDMPPSTCEAYCDVVLKNCTGKYEQYRTLGQCLSVCQRLPVGSPGDENVNSVECRIRQARIADGEAFLYCKSAGPLGEGRCGSNCEAYCSLMTIECTKDSTATNLELSYFDSNEACMSNCTAMAVDPSGPTQYSSSATNEPSALTGNNVYCRAYHVAAGIEQDEATEHCPHAMGGYPCTAQ
jgi:hypothetical protein